MANTTENLLEASKKALESPDNGQRGKGKLTLLREEAEERFVEELKEDYKEIIKVHKEEAKKPVNYQERRDLLKRVLGEVEESKPEQHLHLHRHEDSELSEAKRKLLEEYEAKLKELKTK